RGAGLIDYANLRYVIFNALYYPLSRWSPMAAGLADLEKGNGTALAELVCNDGDPVPHSLEHAQQHFEESLKVSEWGSSSSAMRIKCSAWPDIPKAPFRGNTAGIVYLLLLDINLCSPAVDPITPLSAFFPFIIALTC
ncbi:hypothetical protein MPER_06044, partial [Moniliophthora perniciosa FA553]